MHILVVRFSAFGDVAMTVPVLWSVAKKYPQHRFTVVSRESMRPLFLQMPDNVSFRGVNLKQAEYKGWLGMYRLANELHREGSFDAVADLHNVLRTQLLRFFFRLRGIKCAHIDKGKAGKQRLTRQRNKQLVQQPTSFDNYRSVFARLGLPAETDFISIYNKEKGDFSRIVSAMGERKPGEHWVGIAPFAAHAGKVYPLELMERVVARLSETEKIRVFLFGAGEQEKRVMSEWAAQYPRVTLPEGLRMETELILMSHLDLMLSMDSANMHLASLVGTPVLSIWGATHPYCGFMGYGQPAANALQVTDLPCRPCSVFGNKPCLRGDYACLHRLTPEMVSDKVLEMVGISTRG